MGLEQSLLHIFYGKITQKNIQHAHMQLCEQCGSEISSGEEPCGWKYDHEVNLRCYISSPQKGRASLWGDGMDFCILQSALIHVSLVLFFPSAVMHLCVSWIL